ncbi:hypothetical protein SEA_SCOOBYDOOBYDOO_226 [Mycobacterium phage ScoobyDoobyDoo]|nr:hypothetical protein SEA_SCOOBYDOOBYDOO_226 [Mycobacterium phage ScoobyDoobyDoo]
MNNAATPAQIRFINVLLAERLLDPAGRDSIADEIEEGMSKSRASQLIGILKARPFLASRGGQQALDVEVASRPRPSEEGFYLADNGQVFKVVRSQGSMRLYAKQATARGLVYVAGAMNMIFADQKLSGEQIVAQGLAQGFCIVCSSEFEDPTSKHIGIGPVCGRNQLGAEAYKALRATVADRPDVIAFEAAKKAAAKARREAKKAEEAQLTLA